MDALAPETAGAALVDTTACPLCGGASRRLFSTHGCWISACVRCDHRFADLRRQPDHVEVVYGDGYFTCGGAGYTDYIAEGPLLRRTGRQYGALAARHAGGAGTVLDVGAAAGFILQGLRDAGWSGVGVEPNATMARYAREQLGLDVAAETFERFETDRRFDLVSLVQVVAHFPDPAAAIAKAAALTRRGGLMLIEGWRRDSIAAHLFGRRWHEYSPPSVLHWFTREALCALVGRCGLAPIASGRPRKRISAGHAFSLVRFKLGAGEARARSRLERLTLPYPGDDALWVLFRKP